MNLSESNGFWVGIDVAKDTLAVALAHDKSRPDQWAQLPARQFGFDAKGIKQLIQWIVEQPGVCLGLCAESTGMYSKRLVAALAAAPLPRPAVVNPARPLAFARSMGLREKTDLLDAAVLALYGLIHQPRPLRLATGNEERLRACWRAREDFVADRCAQSNRLEQTDDPFLKRLCRQHIRQLDTHIEKIEKEIDALLETDPQLRRDVELLESIPGIGAITARTLLAELGDLRAWGRNEIVGYAGLFPRRYESGTSVQRKPRLARGGGARLRSALFMAALSIRRRSTALSEFANHLVERGKPKKCAIGAMMRKLLLVARAVVISGHSYDPALIGNAKLGLT